MEKDELNSENIQKLWDKSKLNSEKRNVSGNENRYEKYRRKLS